MQGNAAAMLHWACILATEAGIDVAMPVHDALLITGPIARMEADIAKTEACMRKASRIVLSGFELDVDVKRFVYPEHYTDKRGRETWNYLMQLLEGISDA